MNYEGFSEVLKDNDLMIKFEEYIYSNDLNIYMKGESKYLEMKELMLELDSTSVQIQGGLDILDSYFEEMALTQFENEKENLKHNLMIEFADHYNGINAKTQLMAEKDKDIIKALEIMEDQVVYKNIFLPQ